MWLARSSFSTSSTCWPAPGRVAGDRRAVDAAADDQEIEGVHCRPIASLRAERSNPVTGFLDCFVASLLAMTRDGRAPWPRLILVIDAGTTSTRAMLFGADGACLGVAQRELAQHYPRPGWVEHDAEEIWQASLACAGEMVEKAGGAGRIAGIGITNQRETIVFWSRATGEALARAIVWQDRRTAELCARLKEAGHEAAVQAKTGLLLDPYFSGSKIAWAMAHWPALRDGGRGSVHRHGGELAGVQTDRRAARLRCDQCLADGLDGHPCRRLGRGFADLFDAPRAALPEIVDCAGLMARRACSARRSRSPAWRATSRRRRSGRRASRRATPRAPTGPARSCSPIRGRRRRSRKAGC